MTKASDPVHDEAFFVGKERFTWEQFGEVSRLLASRIHESGFRPDAMVAIARGGLPLAAALAYALDVKTTGTLNVEFYSGINSTLPEPVLLPPLLDAASLVGKRVLLLDDVSDSGRTLDLVLGLLTEAGCEVRTCCVFTKPGTILEPDFFWKETDSWILFPWSWQGPVTGVPAEH